MPVGILQSNLSTFLAMMTEILKAVYKKAFQYWFCNMMSKGKPPHFFKIILDDTIRHGKLSIPRKFVKRYANYFSNKVLFLKVLNGPKWRVELIKSGDHIWFGKGWQQFVDYYSLSHGSFLVFRFENLKDCCFSVIIFDKSASEIDYPIHVDDVDYEDTNLDEAFNHIITPEVIEIDASSPRKVEEKLMSTLSRPCKKMKQENGTGLPVAKRGEKDRVVKRTQRLTAKEKANAHKSNKLSFSVTMKPTHVGGRCRVAIPASFAKKYMKKQQGNIILNSVDGKTWSVEYDCTKIRGVKVIIMSRGWRKFVEDNQLEVGDVCAFEVINHNATKFKVVICRQSQDAKSIPSTGNKAIKDTRDLNKFTTVNPYFIVNIRASYLDHNTLHVPVNFVAKCKKRSIGKFFLQVGKKVWPVKFFTSKSDLSAGFSAFANDNSLEAGDVCMFELINDDILLLNVTIFRKL